MLSPSNPNLTPTQVANCLYALEEFAKVPPEEVAPDLSDWVCGTAACFGGWVAKQPYFRAQGVEANRCGAPIIPRIADCRLVAKPAKQAAEHLFGDSDLFEVVRSREVPPKRPRDFVIGADGSVAKEVVLQRLRRVLWPAQGE